MLATPTRFPGAYTSPQRSQPSRSSLPFSMRFFWPLRERSPSTDSECSTASQSSVASDQSFFSADGADDWADPPVDPPPVDPPPDVASRLLTDDHHSVMEINQEVTDSSQLDDGMVGTDHGAFHAIPPPPELLCEPNQATPYNWVLDQVLWEVSPSMTRPIVNALISGKPRMLA